MRVLRRVVLVVGLSSCGGSGTLAAQTASGSDTIARAATSSGIAERGQASSGGGTGRTPTSTSSSGNTSSGGTTGASDSCPAGAFAAALGKPHLLLGFSGTDATAAAAPFDVRYIYLSGGLFDSDSPCASCATSCTADGQSCANAAGGCGWWGCWQYDQVPPGETARDQVDAGLRRSPTQIAMFTYYEILQASGLTEGTTEVAAVDDAAFLTRYLADFRFLLQQIGDGVAFVHVEPDFWGYAEQLNPDPHQIPAAVAQANPTDCGSVEASLAGFGQCLIAMARKYAPNARIGFHASGWASGMDALGNGSASLDVAAQAAQTVAFLAACGAGQGDLIFSDMSDRDAAYYQSIGRDTWWDTTNEALPDFHQAWTFGQAIASGLGLPLFWWQVPVGNMSLPNVCNQWQDNRVDYILTNLDELSASGAVGVAFGAGATCMTTPETDDGNLIAKVQGTAPEPLCR